MSFGFLGVRMKLKFKKLKKYIGNFFRNLRRNDFQIGIQNYLLRGKNRNYFRMGSKKSKTS